jgi:SAM-dependent methyltransferase
MQTLRSLAELDEKLRECDRAEAISDDRLRALFATFRMEPPAGLPADPFAPEYSAMQRDLYRQIAGKDYTTANEVTVFDVAGALRRPFPYATGSCATTGEQFILMGSVLGRMALAPGSRVLEMGAGWGNTTLVLAELGHSVTAVDIEPRFCELIRRRAAQRNLPITVVNADFLWVEEVSERFDAVLFFESFHHSADHMRLLRALHQVLTPEGRIFFGGEPITTSLGYPWGLRLDGQSLWSIRKQGWLELGFSERYFSEALARTGWFARKHGAGATVWQAPRRRERTAYRYVAKALARTGWVARKNVAATAGGPPVWEAQPRESAVFCFPANDPALRTDVGIREDDAIAFYNAAPGTALFGPYISLPAGRYVARLRFAAASERRGQATLDVCAAAGAQRLAARDIDAALLPGPQPIAELAFGSASELHEIEVRLFCAGGFTARIESVEIRPAASSAS